MYVYNTSYKPILKEKSREYGYNLDPPPIRAARSTIRSRDPKRADLLPKLAQFSAKEVIPTEIDITEEDANPLLRRNYAQLIEKKFRDYNRVISWRYLARQEEEFDPTSTKTAFKAPTLRPKREKTLSPRKAAFVTPVRKGRQKGANFNVERAFKEIFEMTECTKSKPTDIWFNDIQDEEVGFEKAFKSHQREATNDKLPLNYHLGKMSPGRGRNTSLTPRLNTENNNDEVKERLQFENHDSYDVRRQKRRNLSQNPHTDNAHRLNDVIVKLVRDKIGAVPSLLKQFMYHNAKGNCAKKFEKAVEEAENTIDLGKCRHIYDEISVIHNAFQDKVSE